MITINPNADPTLEDRYEQLVDATDRMCRRTEQAEARVNGATMLLLAMRGEDADVDAAYERLVRRLSYTRRALSRIGNARHAAHDARMIAREPSHRCTTCELDAAYSGTLRRFVTIPENDNR